MSTKLETIRTSESAKEAARKREIETDCTMIGGTNYMHVNVPIRDIMKKTKDSFYTNNEVIENRIEARY